MININLKHTRFKKTKAMAYFLAMFLAISPLTSCSNSQPDFSNPETSYSSSQKTQTDKQISSLEEINPTFTKESWGGQYYYVIDEESLLQIIRLAMKNVQEFYTDIGAPNMTYNSNLEIVSGKENFYPEWQNEYFYMARAMSESSRRIDLITTIPSNTPDNYAHGIMQVCPTMVKDTLEQYYRNIFNEDVELSDIQVIPSKEDLAKLETSSAAKKRVIESIANNIALSIAFDVYNIKNINPITHQNYYENYGGYNEEIRRLATIGLYGTSRSTVINGLIEGNLRSRLNENKHMRTYLVNMAHYEKLYRQQFEKNKVEYEFEK